MTQKNDISTVSCTRRGFLKGIALSTAFTIIPRAALGGEGYIAPSEELTCGIIGVGGMGRGHIRYPGARLLAVSDVDSAHLAQGVKEGEAVHGGKIDAYKDFRELLARPDIDIVHIATPPHWHAMMSIAAAEAGKDVWCEKPMTRTIGEGERVVRAVQQYGRMFRVNTWFRFKDEFYSFGSTGAPIKKVVESGMLGWPLKVTVGVGQGFNWKFYWSGMTSAVPQAVPAELDYDMWLGPAPYKPYHPHRVHLNFRGYWDYDGGGLGDMAQHYLDPVQYFLDKDNESPVYIEADAPQQHPDAVGSWRRVVLRYADGCEIVLDGDGSLESEPYIQGPTGKLMKGFTSDIPDFEKKVASLPEPAPRITDFHESVRTRQKFALNEMNAHRSCTLVNLAKTAIRIGRPLHFDPKTQRFINDEAANRLADEPTRAPWRL